MPRKIKLYMFAGSAPSMTAQLMLEHKGLGHKCKHLEVVRIVVELRRRSGGLTVRR